MAKIIFVVAEITVQVAVLTSSVANIMFVVVETTLITSMANIIFLVNERPFNVAVVTSSVANALLYSD